MKTSISQPPCVPSLRDDRGSVTAEYAIATMTPVSLVTQVLHSLHSNSDTNTACKRRQATPPTKVKGILTDMVRRALGLA